MNSKKILICGAGCIGTYLGTKLNSQGHQVYLFGRRKLKEIGDSIKINDREYKMPEKIFKLPKNERFDFILITSKLYDLERMIKMINKHHLDARFLASIQNGLIDNSKYRKILHHKLVPVTVFSGFRFEKGKLVARETRMGWKTEDSKEGKEVAEIISEAGINCQSCKNFDSLRAEKTIVNCSLNALSAIEDKPFSSLFKEKSTRERVEKLFNECYQILKNEYNLEEENKIKQRMIRNWSKMKHYSSTQQDKVSGRNLETNFFNGYIVQLAKKYKIPAEENKKIVMECRK